MTENRLKTALRLVAGTATAAALAAGGLAATAAPAAAATGDHYVNCAAKTNGDGSSPASAWNNLGAVNGHGDFVSGERILLKRGTTCKGQLAPKGSGSAGSPIVIGAYDKGAKPTVAGGGTANNSGAVQIVNQQYWTVQDLHITNATKSANPKTYRSGLLFQSDNGGYLAGMTAQRLTIDSVRSNPGNGNTRAYGGISALTFGTAVKSGFTGLRILDNRISNVSRTGIAEANSQYPQKGTDTGTRIAGNVLKGIRGDGILMLGVKNGRIDHNVVSKAGNLGSCSHCGRYGGPSTASAGIWPANTTNTLIEYNEVSGTYKAGGDGEGFDIDRSAIGTVMQYNYAHDNQGGGVLVAGARDSVIRFNVFENNGQSALSFYGKAPSKNTKFYNNTVFANSASNAKVVRTFGAVKGSKVYFANNIVYSSRNGAFQWPTTSRTVKSNTFVGVFSNRAYGAGNILGGAGLKSPGNAKTGFGSLKGYKPINTKTFRKGVAIPKSVKKDIFGKKINPAKPPRGAAG